MMNDEIVTGAFVVFVFFIIREEYRRRKKNVKHAHAHTHGIFSFNETEALEDYYYYYLLSCRVSCVCVSFFLFPSLLVFCFKSRDNDK